MITNLTIGRYGRFGNQLFQIAALIGIARMTGQEFAIPEWINHDHKERFGSTEDVDLQKHFVNPLPILTRDARLWPERAVPWGYHDVPVFAGDWNLTGHFQSEKYFDHCIEEVRHYFRMSETELNKIQLGRLVAIHLRRGDYDNNYHNLLGLNYYWKAMEQFPDNQNYVLFTDDKIEGRRFFGNNPRVIIPDIDLSYIEDFSAMKLCGGFICANSSFSLMAAILSEAPNKKIVCPSQWFGPAWNPDTKDLYPKNAIVI